MTFIHFKEYHVYIIKPPSLATIRSLSLSVVGNKTVMCLLYNHSDVRLQIRVIVVLRGEGQQGCEKGDSMYVGAAA